MSWFLFTIFGPLLYATCNHIDKILLEKYLKRGGVGTLMLVSSFLSVLVVPVLFAIDPTLLSNIQPLHVAILFGVGLCNVLVLWFYFLALKDDEASIVIVFYQLVPVIGYILGYFVLGEVLTHAQLAAMTIIILGTSIVSIEVDVENHFKVKGATVGYMLAACFFWALGSVIFKAVALEESVVQSLFWEHIALFVIGVLLFALVRSYREDFLHDLHINSKRIITLNISNEILYMLGTVLFSFAYLLAPISLVLLANSFQPIFVLAIGIILTVFFPKVSVEKIHAKGLWQKGAAVAITAVGTYLLLSSS